MHDQCVEFLFSVDSLSHDPVIIFFFFLMIRRPPRSTLDRSSAASDVYKRQGVRDHRRHAGQQGQRLHGGQVGGNGAGRYHAVRPVSYTHLRAHETVLDLVCRLLLEKKKNHPKSIVSSLTI